jgi:hypothetical protein
MTDADKRKDNGAEDALDALFAAMRRDASEATPGLLARVLADAEDQQDRVAEQTRTAELRVANRQLTAHGSVVRQSAGRSSGLASVLAGLGGWGGLAGMLTATVTGVWIGLTGGLPTIANAAYWVTGDSAAAVELLPGSVDFTTALVPEEAE